MIESLRSINIVKIRQTLPTGKALFLYTSFALFMAFVGVMSWSVNRFINDTLSISFPNTSELSTEPQGKFEVFVKPGETFSKILYSQEIPPLEVQSIINAAKKLSSPLNLKAGQRIEFEYDISVKETEDDDLVNETYTIKRIAIHIDKIKSVEIIRSSNEFTAKLLEIPLKKLLVKSSTVVKSSFMEAARALGIPHGNVIELVNTYSHQIDFQRQVQPGDKLNLIVEKYTTDEGEFSHYGKVVFASLQLSGKPYNIYRYSHDGADNHQYFSEDGKSVKRNLLRTPIGVAKLSSHFGKRKHPVLGYTKMHKGVDFAAAPGTPIYAAGSGIVKEIGWKSGYGRYVEIRHSSTLSTAYAHASAFAKGLSHGSIVKQGQTIAYVGASGRTTGPHLHYEVKINGKHVNPLSIKTTPGIELAGTKMKAFTEFKKKLHKMYNEI